jgi:phospholipid/cholesterol/gamma-HCH transport system substrate-binding protein
VTRRRGQIERVGPFGAGVIALVVIAIALYAAFVHQYPWQSPYELKAVFANASNIALKSPVRVAGVTVGKVTSVSSKKGSTASVVTMELSDNALPLHRDATLKIRPRIFLEGNFFVDLQPGSPEAPTLGSNSEIPMSQTYSPVQIDQVLTSLQQPERESLQKLVQGYGEALNGKPKPGEDAAHQADPATRGKTAAQALNDSLRWSPRALKGLAIVNDALLGEQPHDLSKLIASSAGLSTKLAQHEDALKNLITNFNTTMAAFSSQAAALHTSIHVLPQVLSAADSALLHLNRSFPPLRQFAKEILPGVRETPATVNASFPWIAQTRALLSPAELQGLARDLRPTIKDLASVTDESVKLLPQVDLVSRCMTDVVLPTGDVVIKDPPLDTGLQNYKEFWQTMVGLSGESQNFDGNGQYTRFQTGGGTQTVSTGKVAGISGTNLFGNALEKPIGTRPVMPAHRPPYNRTVPCYKNQLPDVNGAATGAGP